MNKQRCAKELYYWQYGSNATNFHSLLYSLIAKADPENRARLRAGFPNEVLVYEEWQKAPDSDQFFRAYGYPER